MLLASGALLVISFFGYLAFGIWYMTGGRDLELNLLGDAFGVLNAFASGGALFAFAYSLYLQLKEYQHQTFEFAFVNQLNIYQHNLQLINVAFFNEGAAGNGRLFFDKYQRFLYYHLEPDPAFRSDSFNDGFNVHRHRYLRLAAHLMEVEDEDMAKFNFLYIHLNGGGALPERTQAFISRYVQIGGGNVDDEDAPEEIEVFNARLQADPLLMTSFSLLYQTHRYALAPDDPKRRAVLSHAFDLVKRIHSNILAHYFRSLYELYRYVDESRLHPAEKSSYCNMLTAQLSDAELFVLAVYVAVRPEAEAFRRLAVKYNLVEPIQDSLYCPGGLRTFLIAEVLRLPEPSTDAFGAD